MKKFLTLITCFILLLVPAFSAYDANEVISWIAQHEDEVIIGSLLPYDGASDINMRTTHYPERATGENAGLTWASSDGDKINTIDNSNNKIYLNEHMVAMGGLELLPDSKKWYKDYHEEWEWDDWHAIYYDDCYRISLSNYTFEVNIDVDCPSDFEFVSQSDTSYRRPFLLYYLKKSSYTGSDGRSNVEVIDRSKTYPLPFSPPESESPSNQTKPGVWFDMILALPYEEYNDVGVVWDSTLYPLKDATDYTSMVTLTLRATGTVSYNVYYADKVRDRNWNSNWGQSIGTIEYPIKINETVSIPFFGYSAFDATSTESVGSLYIATTPESQNINLNPGATAGRIKVADISYLLNDGREHSSKPAYDPSLAWIFLSASPDPYDSNENGFRLINDKAGNILTSNNNVPFTVEVQGINKSRDNAAGEGAGGFVEFDGKAQRSSFPDELPSGAAVETNFIHTSCEYGRNLPHVSAEQHYHYHSFEGEVYVQLRPNSTTEPLMAGRYIADIYVHVFSE